MVHYCCFVLFPASYWSLVDVSVEFYHEFIMLLNPATRFAFIGASIFVLTLKILLRNPFSQGWQYWYFHTFHALQRNQYKMPQISVRKHRHWLFHVRQSLIHHCKKSIIKCGTTTIIYLFVQFSGLYKGRLGCVAGTATFVFIKVLALFSSSPSSLFMISDLWQACNYDT